MALGKLESACHRGECTLTASFDRTPLTNESWLFEVRRVAGASLPLPSPKPGHDSHQHAIGMIAAGEY
jgi:hypothetical protein